VVKAVDGVSFDLKRGEVLGLVGESGCGKSLTALSIMRLLPKGSARTLGGEVRLGGENILTRSQREMREIRGRRISMILQDPQTRSIQSSRSASNCARRFSGDGGGARQRS